MERLQRSLRLKESKKGAILRSTKGMDMKRFALALCLLGGLVNNYAATKSVVECETELGEAANDRKLVSDCLLRSMGTTPDPTQEELQQRKAKHDAFRAESMSSAAAAPMRVSASLLLSLCRLDYESQQIGDLSRCTMEGKTSFKKAYEKELKSVKKPASKAALKEYYIAAVSALQGIEPQADERKINYEKRQGDNKNKLDEMWTRFEVEN